MDINNDNTKPNTRLNASKNFDPQAKEQVFEDIICKLVEGTPIYKILESDKDYYPNAVSFFKWINNDPVKAGVYKYAREVLAHKLFDRLIDIAEGDKETPDTVVKVQRDRLLADTVKFYIAKILPKVYGEKIDVTSGGEAINVVSLGVGIAPTEDTNTGYIDVTEGE